MSHHGIPDLVPSPRKNGYTIYSKLKCKYCDMVKELLTNAQISYIVIQCDNYLDDERVDDFLDTMENFAGKSCSKFPMVFNNGIFVGGYKETQVAVEQNNCIMDNNDF